MVTAAQFGRGHRTIRPKKEYPTDQHGVKLLKEGDEDFSMRCSNCNHTPVKFPTSVCFDCDDKGIKK